MHPVTFGRIFQEIIRRYLFPEFELFRMKFYHKPNYQWSLDANAKLFKSLIVRKNYRTTTLDTTVAHVISAEGM